MKIKKKYKQVINIIKALNKYVDANDIVKISNNDYSLLLEFINDINNVDYNSEYLTIESLQDNNTISWQCSDGNLQKTIFVSVDDGETWIEKTSSTLGTELAILNIGDKLLIKGNNLFYGLYDDITLLTYNNFISTNNFNIKGNIMSLIYGDNFIEQTILDNSYVFAGLFYNCDTLISAEKLILPATTLTEGCYRAMFSGCTALEKAPELPATTLTEGCYRAMFNNCKLIEAPELHATTLASNCYNGMFRKCASLNSITCLATNISANGCTSNWVNGVASSGTFIKASSMTDWTTGTSGIPEGWNIQNYSE